MSDCYYFGNVTWVNSGVGSSTGTPRYDAAIV